MINKSLVSALSLTCLITTMDTHAEGYLNENMVVFVSEEDPEQSPWKDQLQCKAISKAIGKGIFENQYTFQNGKPLTSIFLSSEKINDGECEHLVQFPEGIQGTGVFESFYPNGKTHSRIEYKNGEYNGKLQFWFANGLKQQENQIVNGQADGDYKIWHPNGQLAMSGKYKHDIPVGMRQRWYASGDPWTYVRFDQGRMVGELKQWFKNGKLERQGHYKNGLREGAYQAWYASGKPEADLVYQQGKIISAQCWSESGVLKPEKRCLQAFEDEH